MLFLLLIGSLEINFSEILIKIRHFLYKNMHLKLSSTKWRPFCPGGGGGGGELKTGIRNIWRVLPSEQPWYIIFAIVV